MIDLQVILCDVGRVRQSAIDEFQIAGQGSEPGDLGIGEEILDAEEQMNTRFAALGCAGWTWKCISSCTKEFDDRSISVLSSVFW